MYLASGKINNDCRSTTAISSWRAFVSRYLRQHVNHFAVVPSCSRADAGYTNRTATIAGCLDGMRIAHRRTPTDGKGGWAFPGGNIPLGIRVFTSGPAIKISRGPMRGASLCAYSPDPMTGLLGARPREKGGRGWLGPFWISSVFRHGRVLFRCSPAITHAAAFTSTGGRLPRDSMMKSK